MPVRYCIDFDCHGDGCKGHKMSVLDWGIYVLSRRQYARKGRSGAEQDVINKLNEVTDLTKRDTYFFLGNTLAHPKSFMIVGFYWPPLKKAKDLDEPKQPGLPGIS